MLLPPLQCWVCGFARTDMHLEPAQHNCNEPASACSSYQIKISTGIWGTLRVQSSV
jgi:hypothetical protein